MCELKILRINKTRAVDACEHIHGTICNLGLLASRERRHNKCTWLLMFNLFHTFFDKKICLKSPQNFVIFVAKKVVQGIQ